jgi:hypothetical protein
LLLLLLLLLWRRRRLVDTRLCRHLRSEGHCGSI